MRFAIMRRGFEPTWIAVLLFFSALVASLFFQGANGEMLVAAEILLLVCAVWVVWQCYDNGFDIPRTGLTFAVTLYWTWLAISITWSRVPYVSFYVFWWMGTLPLTFWICTLARGQERVWRYIQGPVLLLGFALALTGIYQLLVLGQVPQAMFLNINSYASLLNLITIPAAACFLLFNARQDRLTIPLGMVLFVLVYAIGITQGRGALLTFILGAGLLISVAIKHVPKRAVQTLLVLILSALILANITSQGGMLDRFRTLVDPASAGFTRFLIWQGSWEMLKEFPWWGIGLGNYSLAWPPYWNPEDASAGFFVHNDYLQIWIEAGLPGLLLLVSIVATALWMFVRLLNQARGYGDSKVQMAGLLGGFFAIATHSLVDFNFYVVPILALSGAILARVQTLAAAFESVQSWRIQPRKWLGLAAYRTIILLLFMFPLTYLSTLSLSARETSKGVELAEQGLLEEAEESFIRAARLNPRADNILMTQADLYRHAIMVLPASFDGKKQELFDLARELLTKAEQLNPLRVQTFLVRARLYQQNPELLGGDQEVQIANAFEHAIRLNPRSFGARLAYAKYLLSRGRTKQAKEVLEVGLRYAHTEHISFVPYYALTAKLRSDAGEPDRALELKLKIQQLLETAGANTASNTVNANERK
jgi:O-antigen ligase